MNSLNIVLHVTRLDGDMQQYRNQRNLDMPSKLTDYTVLEMMPFDEDTCLPARYGTMQVFRVVSEGHGETVVSQYEVELISAGEYR